MIENLSTELEQMPPHMQRVLTHFDAISNISRPSEGEAEIREYLIGIAKKKGWSFKRDEIGNLTIDVPATQGYGTAPRTIVQGHMDMVYLKNDDQGPRKLRLDNDWIRGENDKTSGTDNGLGIAMALAAAEDPNAIHGPMTLLFTVDEEGGMKGADQLDAEIVPADARVLINLDSEFGPQYVTMASAGGNRMTASIPIEEREKIPEGYGIFKISLSGMEGGHSGVDIHQGYGNALDWLNRLLIQLNVLTNLKLISFSGGDKQNSIPQEAEAVVAFDPQYIPQGNLETLLRMFIDVISLETRGNKENLRVSCEEVPRDEATPVTALTRKVRNKLFNLLNDLPNGPLKTRPEDTDKVLVSNNIGTAETTAEYINIGIMARANGTSQDLDEISNQVQAVCENLEISLTSTKRYEPWNEDPDAPAIQMLSQAIQEVTGKIAILIGVHGGLECESIKKRLGNNLLTLGSIGPLIRKAHKKGEEAYLPSVDTAYQVHVRTLEKIATSVWN